MTHLYVSPDLEWFEVESTEGLGRDITFDGKIVFRAVRAVDQGLPQRRHARPLPPRRDGGD